MSGFFVFNGTSSNELGIIVTKPIVRPTWAEETAEFKLIGNHKIYRQNTGIYKNADMTVEIAVPDTSESHIQQIYSILHGKGQLSISTAPNEYLNVCIEPLSPNAIAKSFGLCSVQMTVDPFAYLLDSPTITISDGSDYTEIENRGTIYCEPEIRFKPQSVQTVIDVNGAEFTVNTPAGCSFESTIVLDCEEEVAYFIRPEGQAYPCLQYTYGDFPIFHTGKNYVKFSGTNEIEIKVKERCL